MPELFCQVLDGERGAASGHGYVIFMILDDARNYQRVWERDI